MRVWYGDRETFLPTLRRTLVFANLVCQPWFFTVVFHLGRHLHPSPQRLVEGFIVSPALPPGLVLYSVGKLLIGFWDCI